MTSEYAKVELKQQSIQRIYADDVSVGHILCTRNRHRTLRPVRNLFSSALPELDKVTPPYTYIWIDEIFVIPRYRGLGLAERALSALVSTHSPCVVALGVGQLDDSVPYAELLTIYRRLGFRLLNEGSDVYAIRVHA